MKFILSVLLFLYAGRSFGQESVNFPLLDGTKQLQGDLYGKGPRGLVLAHGGRFHKESWKKQAPVFAKAGFLVLAVGFRGDGLNPDGSQGSRGSDEENTADILAAIGYLHKRGVRSVSAVGASLGGTAVGEADAQSTPGTLARVVFLGSDGGNAPEELHGRKLFLVAREDRSGDGLRLPEISQHYAAAPEPKKLVVVEGTAHAQSLFDSDQGPRTMKAILDFLLAP